ncbi:hypothetical protein ILYODFUR_012967 [Ilyodon furcidens]|uniref:Uncharacterized protein n=1 Tax=Ilyodon furcidens TaxID=33524 RepID=A0ABV0U507_9TELE
MYGGWGQVMFSPSLVVQRPFPSRWELMNRILLFYKLLLMSLNEPQLWSLHLPVTPCKEGRGENTYRAPWI